jgi:hypothetical protein
LLKVFRAVLCLRSSDFAAARSSLESVLEHHPEMHGVRSLYAITLWANGDSQGARDQLDERVEACANADADVAYWMAAAKAVTEDHDAAFRWLARSVEMGNENRRWIDIDPTWDGCRDDERFLAALAGTAASSSATTGPTIGD